MGWTLVFSVLAFRLSLTTCVIIVGYQLSPWISANSVDSEDMGRRAFLSLRSESLREHVRTFVLLLSIVMLFHHHHDDRHFTGSKPIKSHYIYSIICMLYPLNPIQHSKLSLCLWHAQHSYYSTWALQIRAETPRDFAVEVLPSIPFSHICWSWRTPKAPTDCLDLWRENEWM